MNAPLLLQGKDRRKAMDEIALMLEEADVRKERKLQGTRGWYDDNGILQGGLMAFIRYFWAILEPETPLQEGWAFYAICLPYQSQITTRDGQKSIGDIVESKWQGDVLSFNHATLKTEWKPIVHHMKSAGKPLIKIKSGTTVLSLTDNHPIFTSEHGYIRADQVKAGDTLWLHSLPERISSTAGPEQILRPSVLSGQSVSSGAGQKQSGLQTLWQAVLSTAIPPSWRLLLNEMLWAGEGFARKSYMSEVWGCQDVGCEGLSLLLGEKSTARSILCLRDVRQGDVSHASKPSGGTARIRRVLRHEVCGFGMQRKEQHLLRQWKTGSKISSRFLDRATACIEAGKALLFSLFEKVKAGCSPHRPGYIEQRVMEPCGAMPQMPLRSTRTYVEGAGSIRGREIGWAIVDSVERDQWIPDAVYNIEVLDNNNYFAESVLVHNCEHLEAVSFGEITRLLINVSPGSAKSITTDVFWPAWEWTALGKPHLRYLAVSYSADLTERDNDRFVNLLSHGKMQRMYPLRLTKTGVQLVANNKTGWKKASSVGGAVTGLRADRVVADDLHSVKEIESETVRTETVRWFRESLSNRLNDLEASVIVVIMQRLNTLDVAGVILELGLDYEHLCIPMEYDFKRLTDNDGKPLETSIGWSDPRYDPDPDLCEGLLAWPERFSPASIEQIKKEGGPFLFSSQYQQSPSPRGGNIILGEWWQLWDPPNGQFPEFDFILASTDTAFTKEKQNDPSALTVWGCFKQGDERRIMLIDAWEKRVRLHGSLPLQEAYEYNSNAKSKWNGPPNAEYLKRCEAKMPREPRETDRSYYARIQQEWGLVEWLIHTCRVRRVDRLIIEGKANGHDAAYEVERIAGREGWGIELVTIQGDKVARALAVQPIFSQGLVYAPNRPFADKVIEDCEVFPRGKNDHTVDATTGALKWLRSNGFADRPQEIRDRKDEEARFKPKPKALYSGLD